MENKRNILIGEGDVVCRLCIKIPPNCSYIALGETGDKISLIRDMIQSHLPEMDLSISEKPIICEVCHVQLENYVSFATNCMAVEEKIKLYRDLQQISGPVDLACLLQFMEDKALDLQNKPNKDLVIKKEDDSLMVKVEKVQDAEDYILEDHLVDSSSPSELYLTHEEIEIKSENDEMSEDMDDPVPTVAPYNSGKSNSLKGKRQIRKLPSEGRRDKWDVLMLKCDKCEYETRYKSHMVQHMAKHRDPGVEIKFKCDKCTYKTNLKFMLRRHILIHKDKSEVEMYKCANCEFETRHKSHLNQHIRLKHRDPTVESKFKCDKCLYETDLKGSLRKHNLIHQDKSEVEMHKCETCGFETRHKNNMTKHMVKHHDPKRKLKCDKCPYETNFKTSLHMHNLIHMHKCENCDFQTKRKRSMIRHMVQHRDPRAEREFKCNKCPYETDYKHILSRHNLIHKDKSEVEMYKCDNCQYETKYKYSMSKHMVRRHRDPKAERKFKCDKCPYETDFKTTLRRHNLIHKDKYEVHKCENCEYKTKYKSRMIRHMVKHRDVIAE